MRLFLLFFLSLNCLFLLTSSGRVQTRDERSVSEQTESLVKRGSLATPQVGKLYFYGKFDRKGQPQAPYGAAHAALIIPWYLVGRATQAMLPGVPSSAKNVVLDAAVVASSATFAALTGSLAFLILRKLGISNCASILAASMLALATPVFSYAGWLYSEPLASALLLGAAGVLFVDRHSGKDQKSIAIGRAVLAGLILGIALWVRPAHVIAAPIFLIALLIRDGRNGLRPALLAGAILALFGSAYLIRNQYLFGNPLDFGYPAISGGKNLNSFNTPIFRGLYGFLFSPGKSIALFAPPILLAIPGIRKLARRDLGLAVVAGLTPLAYLFFYARYTQWEGGFCVGPRYLIPAIALLCLGLGPMLEGAGRQVRCLSVILFLAGLGVQVITGTTNYLEDQASGAYYDLHDNYRMDYSPLVTMTRQFLHYVRSPQPAPLGHGFDRWFVYLFKAGVALNTILALLFIEVVLFVYFWFFVVKLLHERSTAPETQVQPLN